MRFMNQRLVMWNCVRARTFLGDGRTDDGYGPCRSSFSCLQLVLALTTDAQIRNRDSSVHPVIIICQAQLGFSLVPPNYGFGFMSARVVQGLVLVRFPSIFSVLFLSQITFVTTIMFMLTFILSLFSSCTIMERCTWLCAQFSTSYRLCIVE